MPCMLNGIMTRAVLLILGLAMVVQIIRPLGIVGLRRRADAWKIAAIGLVIVSAVAALKPN